MAARLLIAAAVLLASCGSPTITSEIATLESSVVLPEGADRLDAYGRFYSDSGRTIEAVYVSSGMVGHELSDRIGRQEIAPNVYLVGFGNLPIIMDGGCSVLTLSYDRQTRAITGPVCNGMA